VADVFDALTSARPYKAAWTPEAAATYIQQQSGIHFDPGCVLTFFRSWDEAMHIRGRFVDDDWPTLLAPL
jgi:putative two-component system response regulator